MSLWHRSEHRSLETQNGLGDDLRPRWAGFGAGATNQCGAGAGEVDGWTAAREHHGGLWRQSGIADPAIVEVCTGPIAEEYQLLSEQIRRCDRQVEDWRARGTRTPR